MVFFFFSFLLVTVFFLLRYFRTRLRHRAVCRFSFQSERVVFSGVAGPDGVAVTTTQTLEWSADFSITSHGFDLCARNPDDAGNYFQGEPRVASSPLPCLSPWELAVFNLFLFPLSLFLLLSVALEHTSLDVAESAR
eukprot:m.340101 g.340101  ORF g.340101 m.340101 type:complete len:137 (-) comp16543_c6_seq26:661-1071(-)